MQRWLKFVKYLRSFGWEPVVYTPDNPEMPVYDESLLKEVPEGVQVIRRPIREPYVAYKKLTGKQGNIQTAFLSETKSKSGLMESIAVWIRGNLFIPDARKYWIKPSVRYLEQYLREHPVEMLVSTGPPHSMHLIAWELNQKRSIPWLADFRDPWTNIDYYRELRLGRRADRIHRRLEKKVLRDATAVTVVSNGMAEDFHAIVMRRYEVIPNGYDADDMSGLDHIQPQEGKFVLAHIGSLSPARNPSSLWKALGELCLEHPAFGEALVIRIIGKMDYSVGDAIRAAGLQEKVENVDYLPHAEVVAEQKRAHALLLLVNDTPNARLILTGKLFEYLAARRPIICIGPEDGDAAHVIRETHSGRTFDFDETQRLKAYLLELFEGARKGDALQRGGNIERYERKTLTKEMVRVLNSCIASRQGSGSRSS